MFFVLLASVQELDNPNRPDDTIGMALVFLFWLWRGLPRPYQPIEFLAAENIGKSGYGARHRELAGRKRE